MGWSLRGDETPGRMQILGPQASGAGDSKGGQISSIRTSALSSTLHSTPSVVLPPQFIPPLPCSPLFNHRRLLGMRTHALGEASGTPATMQQEGHWEPLRNGRQGLWREPGRRGPIPRGRYSQRSFGLAIEERDPMCGTQQVKEGSRHRGLGQLLHILPLWPDPL